MEGEKKDKDEEAIIKLPNDGNVRCDSCEQLCDFANTVATTISISKVEDYETQVYNLSSRRRKSL
jgi:hypothetical protein